MWDKNIQNFDEPTYMSPPKQNAHIAPIHSMLNHNGDLSLRNGRKFLEGFVSIFHTF